MAKPTHDETAVLGKLVCGYCVPDVFVLVPGPYEMAVFTFLAQPLFAVAAASYLLKALDELGRRKVM